MDGLLKFQNTIRGPVTGIFFGRQEIDEEASTAGVTVGNVVGISTH